MDFRDSFEIIDESTWISSSVKFSDFHIAIYQAKSIEIRELSFFKIANVL